MATAYLLLLDVVYHLAELLVGTALTGDVCLGSAAQHVAALGARLFCDFEGGVDGQDLHFFVHFAFGAAIVDFLLIFLLVN